MTGNPDYLANVYKTLYESIDGFNKTENEFRAAMADTNYASKVYQTLQENIDGFTKTKDEFFDASGLKKKDNLQQDLSGGTKDISQSVSTSPLDIAKEITTPTKTFEFGTQNTQKQPKAVVENLPGDVPEKQKQPSLFGKPIPTAKQFIGDDGIKAQKVIQNLSNQGNYEMSNKVIEQLPSKDAYASELMGYNYSQLAKQSFTKGQFKEAQQFSDLAKQNLDDAEKLYATTKTVRPSVHKQKAEINLVNGNYLQAYEDADKMAKSYTPSYGFAGKMDSDKLVEEKYAAEHKLFAEQMKYNSLVGLNIPKEELKDQEQSVNKLQMQVDDVDKELRYKEWIPTLRSSEMTVQLASMMGFVFPATVQSISEGIDKVGSGIDLMAKGLTHGNEYGTEEEKDEMFKLGALKTLNGAASITFGAAMTATPSGAVMNLAFDIPNMLGNPEALSPLMQPVSFVGQKVFGAEKPTTELSEEKWALADLVGMTVLMGALHKVSSGEWRDPKSIEYAKNIIDKIETGKELTKVETEEMYRWVQETPPEIKQKAIDVLVQAKDKYKQTLDEKIQPIISEQPTGKIEVPKEEVKPIETKPVETTGGEKTSTGGGVQSQEKVAEPVAETPKTENVAPEALKDVESTTRALDEIDNKKTGNDNISGVAEKTIPNDFKDKIDEFKKTQKIVRFKIGDTEIFIYNDKLNKFPTSSINNPKHIYINLDHLSDASKIFGFRSDYVDAYYAFLHELEHSDKKHDAVSTKDWDKYINSTQEVEAAKRADNWIRDFQSNKTLSEAYHAAKIDGTNPELVKAVEDLLGKKEIGNDISATTKAEAVDHVVEIKKTETKIPAEKPKESNTENPVPPEGLREEEYPDWVEANSNDPAEIYNAYQQEKLNIPYENLEEWQKAVLDSKTTEESFKRFGDVSNINKGLARRFFKKGSQTIDQIAQGLTEQGGYGEVTPQQIAKFITDISSKMVSARKTTDLGNMLRSKYKKITGRNIDKHQEWQKEIRDEEISKEAIEMAENTSIEDIDNNLLNIIDRDGINISNFDKWKEADKKHGFPPLDEVDYELIKKYLKYENTQGETGGLGETKTTTTSQGEGMGEKSAKIAEQVKSDIAKEISEKEQQIRDVEKKKSEKLKKYNERNTLFGDKEAIKKEEELFDVESKVGKISAEELVKDENAQIDRLNKDIDAIKNSEQKRIDKAIELDQAQTELELESVSETPKEPLPIYKEGSTGNASGAFADVEGKDLYTGIDSLKTMDFPELLVFAKELSAKVRSKKLKEGTLGTFMVRKLKRNILLSPDLFKEGNEGQLAKTMAHEIGHLADYVPDGMGGKGILGKIAAIKDYIGKKLPFKKGAEGELTKKDIDRLKEIAKQQSKDKKYERVVDEEIEKTIQVRPSDILDIWNSIGKTLNKNLYDYIAKLDTARKKSIVLEAMKGMVADELKQFADVIKEKTGKKITITEILKGDWKKRLKELIEEETTKRKLFDENQIRDELISLSEWWRPYDKVNSSPKYKKYRESANELYADAISVLLNSPEDLNTKAPSFFKAFFNYLAEKPEVQNEYIKLQQLLNKGKEEVVKDRINRQIQASKESVELYKLKQRNRDKDKNYLTFANRFIRDHISQISPVIRKIGKDIGLEKLKFVTTDLSPLEKVRNDAELIQYQSNRQMIYSREVNDVLKILHDSGLEYAQFEAYLKNKRIAGSEYYKDKAKPGGLTEKNAHENLDRIEKDIKSRYGEDGWDSFNEALDAFYDANWKIIEENKSMFSDETYKNMEKEKGRYVTFMPIDKVMDYEITPAIKKVIGTLEQSADTFITTQIKMNAIISSAIRNTAIKSMKEFSGDLFEKAIPIEYKTEYGTMFTFKDKPHYKTLTWMDNGKLKAIYVPKDVYDMYRKMSNNQLSTVSNMMNTFTQGFKMIVTKYRPKFAMLTNPVRDLMSSAKKMYTLIASMEDAGKTGIATELVVTPFYRIAKELPYSRMAATYVVKNKRGIIARMLNIKEEDLKQYIDEAVEQGAFPLNTGIKTAYDSIDTEYKAILDVVDPTKRMKTISDYMKSIEDLGVVKWYNALGSGNEIWSKAMGYHVFKKAGFSPEKAGYLTRNYVGTPNFLDGGIYKRVSGTYIPFYNVLTQALRSDYALATSKQTSTAYWIGNATYMGVPAVLSGLAAAGVFGDDLKNSYDKISNYISSNFITIPIARLEDDSELVLTIPMNDVERLIYSSIHKMTKEIAGDEKFTYQDLLDNIGKMGELTPSLHPIFKVGIAASTALAGGNPYDTFKKKKLFSESVMSKNDSNEKIIQFSKWSGETIGLGDIIKMFDYDANKNTTTEYAVKNIPILNAILRVPSTGQVSNLIEDYENNIKKRNNTYKIKMVNLAGDISDSYTGNGTIGDVIRYAKSNKEKIVNTLKVADNEIFNEENDTKQINEYIIKNIMIKGDKTSYGVDFRNMYAVKRNYEDFAYMLYDYRKRDPQKYDNFKKHFKEKSYLDDKFFTFVENDIEISDGFPIFHYGKTFKDDSDIRLFKKQPAGYENSLPSNYGIK